MSGRSQVSDLGEDVGEACHSDGMPLSGRQSHGFATRVRDPDRTPMSSINGSESINMVGGGEERIPSWGQAAHAGAMESPGISLALRSDLGWKSVRRGSEVITPGTNPAAAASNMPGHADSPVGTGTMPSLSPSSQMTEVRRKQDSRAANVHKDEGRDSAVAASNPSMPSDGNAPRPTSARAATFTRDSVTKDTPPFLYGERNGRSFTVSGHAPRSARANSRSMMDSDGAASSVQPLQAAVIANPPPMAKGKSLPFSISAGIPVVVEEFSASGLPAWTRAQEQSSVAELADRLSTSTLGNGAHSTSSRMLHSSSAHGQYVSTEMSAMTGGGDSDSMTGAK